MRLSLDRGGRTTREYEGPAVAPRVQAALDAAMLNVEPDIEVDVTALSSKTAVRGMRKNSQGASSVYSSKSSSKSSTRLSGVPGAAYPASRGLVPK
jgi:kinesin family protein 3/17